MNKYRRYLPAEWMPQSGIQLTWPHEKSDWRDYLDEVRICFSQIATEVSKRQKVLIVTSNIDETRNYLQTANLINIRFIELPSNDIWSRDHGAITVFENGLPVILDFKFNGWGLKYPANFDNNITAQLFNNKIFSDTSSYKNLLNFVLEGGSIESDGNGTILTTANCLLSAHRNGQFNQQEIENLLKEFFGTERILWLTNGYLEGDDTDSHIDTLARFCNENTIAYVQCDDPSDSHYKSLNKMRIELEALTTVEGKPYRLIALPMADAAYYNKERLPATYANFLIINNTVLLPEYGSKKDNEAKAIMQNIFPDREIIGINCNVLIRQHGSLHCVTMQYPETILR